MLLAQTYPRGRQEPRAQFLLRDSVQKARASTSCAGFFIWLAYGGAVELMALADTQYATPLEKYPQALWP